MDKGVKDAENTVKMYEAQRDALDRLGRFVSQESRKYVPPVKSGNTSNTTTSKADERIFNMLRGDENDIDEIRDILENEEVAPYQKAMLESLASAATARSGLGETSQGIYVGTAGFKGLRQYRRDLATAVRKRDFQALERQEAMLSYFAKGQASKESALKSAQELVANGAQGVGIVPQGEC